MIEPLRYIASSQHRVSLYKAVETLPPCSVCDRGDRVEVYCEVCKAHFMCSACFQKTHRAKGLPRSMRDHNIRQVVIGSGHSKRVLRRGDMRTKPQLMDWVTVHYMIRVRPDPMMLADLDIKPDDERAVTLFETTMLRHARKGMKVVESTYFDRRPLSYQAGTSGPCIHLQVLDCAGLASADVGGTSDPYINVLWREKLVGRTMTKWRTLNPRWTKETFVLPLEEQFYDAMICVMHGTDPAEKRRVMDKYRLKATRTTPLLRLDVYDYDALSRNDFLGQKFFHEVDLLRLIKSADPFAANPDRLSFKLMPRQAQGKVGLRAYWDEVNRTILLKVTDCKGLDAADVWTNTSDPYCKVYFNDKLVGKSPVVEGELNPVWDDAYFTIQYPADGPHNSDCSLRIQVYDWDQFSADDPLGQVDLSGTQLLEVLRNHKLDYENLERDMACKWSKKYGLLYSLWMTHSSTVKASKLLGETKKSRASTSERRSTVNSTLRGTFTLTMPWTKTQRGGTPKTPQVIEHSADEELSVQVLYPKIVRSGYIARWYADQQFLIYYDEDDRSWLGADLFLMGPGRPHRVRIEGTLDFMGWRETYELLKKLTLYHAERDTMKQARIKSLPRAYWRPGELKSYDPDRGFELQFDDGHKETITLSQSENIRIEILHRDMKFQPWPLTYRLLRMLYRYASTSRALSGTEASNMRTIDIIDAAGISTTGFLSSFSPEMGLSVSLDTGESIFMNSTTPYHIRLYSGDLTYLPWEDVYALLLRVWNCRNERDMSVGVRMWYQGTWRPGYMATYDKDDGIRIVYDEEEEQLDKAVEHEIANLPPLQAALGIKLTQKQRLERLPQHWITKKEGLPVEIEGYLDFLPWEEMYDLLRKMGDTHLNLDADIDPETADLLTRDEILEVKRQKSRVQILYENHWRSGRIVSFSRNTGMEIRFKDGGMLKVTKDEPVMVRVDNLLSLEEKANRDDKPKGGRCGRLLAMCRPNKAMISRAKRRLPTAFAGPKSDVEELLIIDDCILGERCEFPLTFLPTQNGAGFVQGSIGLRFIGHHRGTVLEGFDKAVQDMTLGEKARIRVRYSEALGDTWGGPCIPPEADLEFDVELYSINGKGSFWTRALMTVLQSLGQLGTRVLSAVGINFGPVGEDDEEYEHRRRKRIDSGGMEEQEEVDEEDVGEEREGEERKDAHRELRERWLKNRGAATDVHTLFSAPRFELR